MTFYKIKQKGCNFPNNAHWVTESFNERGKIWVNMCGGWCFQSDDVEIDPPIAWCEIPKFGENI